MIRHRLLIRCSILNDKTSSQSKGSSIHGQHRYFSTIERSHNRLSTISSSRLIKFGRQSQYIAQRSLAICPPYVHPNLSYAFGRSNDHLIYSNIACELINRGEETPDDLAYVSHFEKRQATFKQINEEVDTLAKALVECCGIGRGDIVGLYAYNCFNWIVIQFACSRIGATLTPINPSYKTHELSYLLSKGKVKCLFMPGPKSAQSELNPHTRILLSNDIVELSKADKLHLRDVIFMDSNIDYDFNSSEFKPGLKNCKFHNWSSTQSRGKLYASRQQAEATGQDPDQSLIIDPTSFSPDSMFAVYYTSGTTGKPKGACVSQFTALNNTRLCQRRIRDVRPDDWHSIVATCLPMFHIFAGVLMTLSPLMGRTTMAYAGYKYDMALYVDTLLKNKANITTLTPTMLIDLLTYIENSNEIKGSDFALKIIQPGGASLPPELVSRAFKILPNLESFRVGYGSTENGAVATFQTSQEPTDLIAHTVGPPIDFTEVRVVRPGSNTGEANAILPLGEKGEIQTRGFNMMVKYLDDDEKTKQVITEDNWYRTGDMGYLHPHGSLTISGRMKHMIIKGGENVYPEEVEQIIHTLDYIEDVHIVGVPDDRFGEQVCAWIKLKPGYRGIGDDSGEGNRQNTSSEQKSDEEQLVHKKDVLAFCRDNITYFKIPKYILFVDDFPMTPTKKVQYNILTERSIKLLGLTKGQ